MKCNNKRLHETSLPTVLLMHLSSPTTYKALALFLVFNNPETFFRKQTPKLVPVQCVFRRLPCTANPRSRAFIAAWTLSKKNSAAHVMFKENHPQLPEPKKTHWNEIFLTEPHLFWAEERPKNLIYFLFKFVKASLH